MKRQIIRYTLKIWLCSSILSPGVAALLQFYNDDGDTSKLDWLPGYPLILTFELIFTSPLWALYWVFTETSSNFFREDIWVRRVATASGLAIAATICLLEANPQGSMDDLFFTIPLGNCVCIVGGCWYFDVSKPVYQ